MEKHPAIRATRSNPTATLVANGIRQLIQKAPAGGTFQDAIATELGESKGGMYFLLVMGDIPFYVEVRPA